MQNKNSKINTILLVVVILLLCVLIFWKTNNTGGDKLNSDNYATVDEKSISDDLNNKEESVPAPKPNPAPKKTSYTIDELYVNQKLASTACGSTVSAEGKNFIVTGYVQPSDVPNLKNSNRIIIRNSPDMSARILDIRFPFNTGDIVDLITQKYNSNPNAWIHISAQGTLKGQDLPMNGTCFRGFYIETSNVIIL